MIILVRACISMIEKKKTNTIASNTFAGDYQ